MSAPLNIGWYPKFPEDDYHAMSLASASGLRRLEKAPALALFDRLDREEGQAEEESEALVIGSATHRAILEPKRFAALYAVAPQCDRRTKEGKALFAEFLEQNEGKEILKADQFALVSGLAAAVRKNPVAADLLANATEIEVTGVWDDTASGVRCKMRADLCCEEYSAIVDIKTCRDASPDAFWRDILRNRYYRQGQLYLEGANALGKHYQNFAILAVEKTPPYLVACYQITEEYLEIGKRELRPLLELYRECEESGEWPGYPDHFIEVHPPKWLKEKTSSAKFKEIQDEYSAEY